MLKIVGSVPFINNKDRKRVFRMVKNEFGDDVTVWVEDKFLYYKVKVNADTVYM